jgi:hypothetical protein
MTFQCYQEGYLQSLERRRREREEERRNAPRPKSLSERITEWWESLSPVEQRVAYSMEFFRYRFGETPQKLGVTLFALGWRRRRRWETGKPHCRVWIRDQ